jgi:hypothetical protein
MKFCKDCGGELPPSAKFCPHCGVAVGVPAPKQDPVASEAGESADKTVTDLIQPMAEPKSASPGETGQADGDANDTVVMDIPSFEKQETAVPPTPPAPQEPEEELGKFSETSWFMAAADIEELDSDSETVSINEDRYKPAADLESEIRKQFSLREPDES